MTLKSLLIGSVMAVGTLTAGAQVTEPTDPETKPVFTQADVDANPDSWRLVDPKELVLMQTSRGRILIELAPDLAPRHVAQFKAYVKAGLYDGTAFHRVIKGFMAQGGDVEATHGAEKLMPPLEAEFTIRRDPKGASIDYAGPPEEAEQGFYRGIPIKTQPSWLADMSKDSKVESWIPHCPGILSSARTGDPNSANAQFFLISDQGRHLDKKYTAKGRAIAGLDVIQSIKLGPAPEGYPIANPDVVTRVVMVSDMPAGERPKAYVQRTDTAEWQATLETAYKTRTDICEVPPVPAVIVDKIPLRRSSQDG